MVIAISYTRNTTDPEYTIIYFSLQRLMGLILLITVAQSLKGFVVALENSCVAKIPA